MNQFTDEQVKTAAIEFMAQQLHYRHGTPIGYIRAGLRAEIKAGDPLLIAAVKAMRAALHTLGPIEVHKPIKLYSYGSFWTPDHQEAIDFERERINDPAPDPSRLQTKLVCNLCDWEDEKVNAWPCPTAQAHDKETQA